MADIDNDEDEKICKIVLIGESGVGKTCIISRYINNTFEVNTMSTTGASYAGKSIKFDNGKVLRFEIWDTAGQEKYRSLTKIFYKEASIAILVYDITNRESFEEIKNYWYGQIKQNGPKNCIIGLAGNKSDLFESETVKEDEAREYAKEIGAIFKLTSANTAAGIEELFKELGGKFYDPNFIPNPSAGTPQKQIDQNQKVDNVVKLDAKKVAKKEKKKKCC